MNRTTRVVGVAVVLGLMIVGCGAAAEPEPVETSRAPATRPTPPPPQLRNATCADWATMDDDARSDFLAEIEPPEGAFVSESAVMIPIGFPGEHIGTVVYFADGTETEGEAAFVEWICADPPTDLIRTRVAELGHDPYSLGCVQLTTAAPEAAAFYAGVVLRLYPEVSLSADELIAMCQSSQTTSFSNPDWYKAGVFWERAASSIAWSTVSRLGFGLDVTLLVGGLEEEVRRAHPVRAGMFIAADGSQDDLLFPPGSACGYDPTTDRYVALNLDATNVTPTALSYDDAPFALQITTSGPLETSTLSLEVYTGDGDVSCVFDGSGPNVSEAPGWSAPFTGQEMKFVPMYLIIKNYVSPRYPDGHVADLARIVLRGAIPGTAEDAIVEFSGTEIVLADAVQ